MSYDWPMADAYGKSLQHPRVAFKDPELRICKVVSYENGQPLPIAGAFAVVFQGELPNGERRAIRAFTSDRPEMDSRYKSICKYLDGQKQLRSLVSFTFRKDGIRAVDKQGNLKGYPLVTMEWVPGKMLYDWVQGMCDVRDSCALRQLSDNWVELIEELRGANIAHGDLSHSNVLVTPRGGLKLVDYDGMCVPDLVGQLNLEIGVEPYQHPERNSSTLLSPSLDNFSGILIFVALRALAAAPDLWRDFVARDRYDKLLFRREDFEQPLQSPLYKALQASPDQEVIRLSKILFDLYRSPMESVRSLRDYLEGKSDVTVGAARGKSLFLLLLDQSYSMTEPLGGDTSTSKRDEIANVVNAWIYQTILRAKGAGVVEDSLDIAVVGYHTDQSGNPMIKSAFVGFDDPNKLFSLADLSANPSSMKTVVQQTYDEESGEVKELTLEVPVWIDPKAEGGTPTCTALHHTFGLISKWIEEHPTGFPPVVVHITDGESSDGDPIPYAEPIKNLSTECGKAFLFNCYLSMFQADVLMFPDGDEILPTEVSRVLFRMSSVLPNSICKRLRKDGLELPLGSRGIVYEADKTHLIKFLEMCSLFQGLDLATHDAKLRLILDAQQTMPSPRQLTSPKVFPMSSASSSDEVFVSYSRRDEPRVMQLVQRLRHEGVSIWIDRDGIDGATVWSEEIVKAIDRCRVLILMASQDSVHSESVVSEVSIAAEQRKPILPLHLEPLKMPNQLRLQLARFHYIEMYSGDENDLFRRLMRALERFNVAKR